MEHESTIDYEHFLEDLVDMYPFSVEEAILVELIANCLDAKVSIIEINTDKAAKIFEIKDNGEGMTDKEFENYHNFSVTFKEKGKGIGFAGLGAKLALKIAENIITETKSKKFRGASQWRFKGKKPIWIDITPSYVEDFGTLVRIFFSTNGSNLLNPETIRLIILKHYLPLFLFADFYKLAEVYPSGIKFVVNGDVLQADKVDYEKESPPVFLTRGRRKKPFGICKFTLSKELMLDEFQGIGISTYGKIINTEQREWFKQQPKSPEKISGIIEVPELVGCLVTSKTAFRKDGSFGVKYYNFYRAAQQDFIKWLEEIGLRERKMEEEKDAELAKKLAKIAGKIITDIPELQTLFSARQIKQVLLPTSQSDETGSLVEGGTQEIVSIESGGNKAGTTTAPGPDVGSILMQPGAEQPITRRQRSIKFGPSISFVSDEKREEVGWTEGLEKVLINKAHPAFRSAERGGLLFYHYVLAVGFAMIRELPPDHDKMAILNKYLTNWGNL
jgi:hypothetical protein